MKTRAELSQAVHDAADSLFEASTDGTTLAEYRHQIWMQQLAAGGRLQETYRSLPLDDRAPTFEPEPQPKRVGDYVAAAVHKRADALLVTAQWQSATLAEVRADLDPFAVLEIVRYYGSHDLLGASRAR